MTCQRGSRKRKRKRKRKIERTGHLNDIFVHSPNIRFRLPQGWRGGIRGPEEPCGDEFLGDGEGTFAASADEVNWVVFLEDDDAIDGL